MSSDLQPNDLFNAAKSYDPKWVERLIIEEKFDPNLKDEKGNTPLFYAADVGDIVAIGYSLSPQAFETIKALIKNGANPDLPNNEGQTVLEIARELVTAGGEYNTWLTLGSILYGNNTPLFKERIKKVEQDFDPKNLFKSKPNNKDSEFPIFPSENNNESKKETGQESILAACILGFGFLLSPLLTLYFTWSDLFSLSSDWLWIDNIIVGVTLLVSGATLKVVSMEKKFRRLIIIFLIPFLACVIYFTIVASFFHPEIRFRIIKFFYIESAFQRRPMNPWVQKGIYVDFFETDTGKKLRTDEELITQLANSLNLDANRYEIRKGFGGEDYAKQGFTVYASLREMNYTNKEIFSRPEMIGLFYSLALAESNSDLLKISEIPKEISNKYINHKEGSYFQIGILENSNMLFFYDQIVKKIKDASEIETELAIFILTQIPVDLDDNSFETIINHWIGYKKHYEKELRYLMALRKEIRHKFLNAANSNKPIKLNLVNSNEISDFKKIKPFLISTGFSVEEGNDMRLPFVLTSEFLSDKKVYRKKPIKKTRTVTKKVYQYGYRSSSSYRTESSTETYTDYVTDGFDIIPTYIFYFSFPEILSKKEEVKLCGMLADCYLNSKNETTISKEVFAGEETWIYALPKKLVCQEGCDGR